MNLKDLGYLDGEIKIYDAMLENLDEMIDDRLFQGRAGRRP